MNDLNDDNHIVGSLSSLPWATSPRDVDSRPTVTSSCPSTPPTSASPDSKHHVRSAVSRSNKPSNDRVAALAPVSFPQSQVLQSQRHQVFQARASTLGSTLSLVDRIHRGRVHRRSIQHSSSHGLHRNSPISSLSQAQGTKKSLDQYAKLPTLSHW